ncbi:MAG: alpha/beta hydrolase [Terriglobales bacterium]
MSKLIQVLGVVGFWLATMLCAVTPAFSSTYSHYERPQDGEHYKDRVIVFVHGLFGNADDTWRYSPGVYWPKLLLTDESFKDTDIYVANYDSPYLGNTMTISEVAESLNSRLESDDVFSGHREVIFVCHSLGGIVVQQLLLTHREYAGKVPFIYFFATPQTGASLAILAKALGSDPLFEALLPGGGNQYLQNLEVSWKAAHFGIVRYCAYEKKTYKGFVIADRLSSTRNCDEEIPINENHVGIVKPNDVRHPSYLALRNAIRKHPIPKRGITNAPAGKSTRKSGEHGATPLQAPAANPLPVTSTSAISLRMGCEIDHLPIHIPPATSIHVIRIHPSTLYGNPRFQDVGVFENITSPSDKALDWPTEQQGRWMTTKERDNAMAAGTMPLPFVSRCTLTSYSQTTLDEIVASLIIGLPDKTKPKSTTPVPVTNLSFPIAFDPLMSGQSFQFYLINTCSSGDIPLMDQWGDDVTIHVLGESEPRTVPLRYQRTSLPGSLQVVMATMGPTSFVWNDLHDCQWKKKP